MLEPDLNLPAPPAEPIDGPRRRTVLGAAALGALTTAGGLVTATSADAAEPSFGRNPFASGVASGDPDQTSVVLWTRIAPDPNHLDMGMNGRADSLPLRYRIRKSGSAWGPWQDTTAKRGRGYTVKVLASGLVPGTSYDYRFAIGDRLSPIGKTQTLPSAASTATCRFALLSCMSFGHAGGAARYFNGLQDLAERTGAAAPDFVVHIGDYMYEFGIPRPDSDGGAFAGTCRTLAQYRARYGSVRRRTYARALHEKVPFFAVPDDHEVWNNVAGGAANLSDLGRYNAALRAWWENMPTRAEYTVVNGRAELTHPGSSSLGQRIRWGKVLDVLLVDTRLQRTHPSDTGTILGKKQREWLLPKIAETTTTWCALATSVPFKASSDDKWSGYPTDRRPVGRRLRERKNAIVLSGDIHCGMVVKPRLQIDGVSRVVATEFVGPPVTSSSAATYRAGGDIAAAYNDRWGYLFCTVTPTAFTSVFCTTGNVTNSAATVDRRTKWTVPVNAPKGTANHVSG